VTPGESASGHPPIAVRRSAHELIWAIWPGFLVAAVAEFVFFSIFDPFQLHFFGAPLDISREAIYSMGFFGFWGIGVASSLLTLFLARPRAVVNNLPPERCDADYP
jgi:hypothetical protein